jgi:hypothetical protein
MRTCTAGSCASESSLLENQQLMDRGLQQLDEHMSTERLHCLKTALKFK